MRDRYIDRDSRDYDTAHAPGGLALVVLGLLVIVLIVFLSSETGQAVMDYIDGVTR
jgi:hypothetical protein